MRHYVPQEQNLLTHAYLLLKVNYTQLQMKIREFTSGKEEENSL
jgi:hypothetical protein